MQFLPRDAMLARYMQRPSARRLSVRTICPSPVGVLLKRLNVGSRKQHRTISRGLYFFDAKDLENRPGSTSTGVANEGEVGQNWRLLTNSWLYLKNGTR